MYLHFAGAEREEFCHYHPCRRTGVMLTDALSKGGLNVPKLEGELAEELKSKLSGSCCW